MILELDANGKIIPDRQALDNVERDYPNESDAEKYRLAQTDCLIRDYYESLPKREMK